MGCLTWEPVRAIGVSTQCPTHVQNKAPVFRSMQGPLLQSATMTILHP